MKLGDGKVKLTIGLIVKNEEEYLEQCLQAIEPILKQMDAELIIADTGSKDRTIEIAKKYTDSVYSFKWCDNFSKARNFVLERSQGEWFMQLDADEIFDDTDPIIRFFESSEYLGYWDADFIVRNYISDDLLDYRDYYLGRLFKRGANRKYTGKVHETVLQIGPVKYLDVFVHHYGYINNTYDSARRKKKKNRNLPLLLDEVKKSPEDIRLLYHLVEEYLTDGKLDLAEDICRKIIEYKKIDHYLFFIIEAFYSLSTIYIAKKEYENASALLEIYRSNVKEMSVRGLDVIYNGIYSLIELEKFEKAYLYFEDFWNCKKEFETKIDKGDSGFIAGSEALKERMKDIQYFQYARVLLKCKKYKKALAALMQVYGREGAALSDSLYPIWIELLDNTKDYQELYNYYLLIKEKNQEQIDLPCAIIIKICSERPDLGSNISKEFSQERDDFASALCIMKKNLQGNLELKQELSILLEKIPIKLYYAPLILIAAKINADISGYIDRCTYCNIDELVHYLFVTEPEIKLILTSGATLENENDLIKISYLDAKLKEQILLHGHISTEKFVKVFREYIDKMYDYIIRLYSPAFYKDKIDTNLPDFHQFIFYMKQAIRYYDEYDLRLCIVSLRTGIIVYPQMKNTIRRLISWIELKLRDRESKQKEFNKYGEKIKNIIRDLILRGDMVSAREALIAYEKVNPADVEILQLKEQFGTAIS